jgi:replicative DNA helicase
MQPPHDIQAEEAVLSSMVLENTVDIVRDILPNERAFHSDATRWMYRAICTLDDDRKHIDVLSVRTWLRDNGKLDVVGGVGEIVRIVDMTPARGHVSTHAKAVRDKWMLRDAIAKAQLLQAQAYHGDVTNVEAWLGQASNAFDSITSNTSSVDMAATSMYALMEQMAMQLQHPEKDTSVKLYTGIRDVDRVLGAMNEKSLVVIGAHPGVGKTTLAREIATNVAKTACRLCPECDANVDFTGQRCPDHPNAESAVRRNGVLYFSRETKNLTLAQMGALSIARIDASKIQFVNGAPAFYDDQLRRLTDAMMTLAKLPMHIIDDVADMVTLRQRARMYKRALEARGVRVAMVVIDYAQLMLMTLSDEMEIRERVIAVSHAALNLAHELSCVVVLLSQLNDEARKSGRAPEVRDLAESKTLEQDANQIILIDNQDMMERRRALASNMDEPDSIAPVIDCADIIIGKNRGGGLGGGGRTGKVNVAFFPAYTHFEDWPEGVDKPDRTQKNGDASGRRRQ